MSLQLIQFKNNERLCFLLSFLVHFFFKKKTVCVCSEIPIDPEASPLALQLQVASFSYFSSLIIIACAHTHSVQAIKSGVTFPSVNKFTVVSFFFFDFLARTARLARCVAAQSSIRRRVARLQEPAAERVRGDGLWRAANRRAPAATAGAVCCADGAVGQEERREIEWRVVASRQSCARVFSFCRRRRRRALTNSFFFSLSHRFVDSQLSSELVDGSLSSRMMVVRLHARRTCTVSFRLTRRPCSTGCDRRL